MSITKKSLISNRGASKKAIVTKPEANKISATRVSLNQVAVKPPAVALKAPAVALKAPAVALKAPAVAIKAPRVAVKPWSASLCSDASHATSSVATWPTGGASNRMAPVSISVSMPVRCSAPTISTKVRARAVIAM